MRQEMSFVSLILFIAIGLLVFAIVFLFAKRQIARFTIRSARSPHAAIGSDAPKPMRLEMERRLRRSQEVLHEPTLMSAKYEDAFRAGPTKDTWYLYRMKALDSYKQFDLAIQKRNGPRRKPYQNPRHYLLSLLNLGLLNTTNELVQEFADAYDHARHDPAVFKHEEYQHYMKLLNLLIDSSRSKQLSRQNSTASTDSNVSQTSQTALINDEVHCRQRREQPPARGQSMSILPEESSV